MKERDDGRSGAMITVTCANYTAYIINLLTHWYINKLIRTIQRVELSSGTRVMATVR